jgi:aspartate kinase
MDVLLVTGEQTAAALMAMTLQRLGVPAASLSNWQTGIRTDSSHGRARIEAVDVAEIRKQLDAGRIAVVAGWTGTTASGDVATFGRGGSDITAVALAAALNVTDHHGACEIYTDVAGVFTADPQVVPDARRHDQISYAAMIELADRGAKVLHPRAAMIGQRYNVPIHVRDSFNHAPGSMLRANLPRTGRVVGCALLSDLARVRLVGVNDPRAVACGLREAFAATNIQAIDLSADSAPGTGGCPSYVKFTTRSTELHDAMAIVDWIGAEHPGCEKQVELGLCQVAVVADGPMGGRHDVQAACERAIAKSISQTSLNAPSCEVTDTTLVWTLPSEHGRAALIAVHAACDLALISDMPASSKVAFA